MATNTLGGRQIIGRYYERFEKAQALWLPKISMKMDSDQESETYRWLGQVPRLREWIGGRQAKGLRDNGFTIENKTFEGTLRIPLADIRRDKTGQIMTRVEEMADSAANHPVELAATLINNGASSPCYDGQYFFDTDHSEGVSGQQSNKITVDISALPVGADFHGTTTDPSVSEMVKAILQSIQNMYGLKDDQGRAINRTIREFTVITPVNLWSAGLGAETMSMLAKGESNLLQNTKFNVDVYAEPELTATDTFYTFASGGAVAPFIHQIEEEMTTSYLGYGSEFEHVNDAHEFGVKKVENMGYGLWQRAMSTQLI